MPSQSKSTHEVPVLVVGAGPAGLAMAAELARHDVGSLVIERHPGTSVFPKASGISTRSMEHFRAWGLEDAIRAHSLDALPFMSVRSTLVEDRGIEVPLGFPTNEQALAVSPTRPAVSPQDHVEPVLLAHVRRQRGVEVRFSTELVEIEQDADRVRATIRDVTSGEVSVVSARYLIGADGTRSSVRSLLGIATHGPDNLGAFLSVLFRADLWPSLGERRFGLYQLDGPVPGVFVPSGPDDRWVFGMPFDPRGGATDSFSDERCIELIRSAAGLPGPDVEVLARMPITFTAQAAERLRVGRAFLVGDAAHRMPPMGGRGMNSAIADAAGLAWKVAWVVRGWAGEALLDTYEAERGPVGRHNLELAAQQGGNGTPDGLTEDLGYVYRSAAIDATDDDAGVAGYLFPTVAAPGARMPHAWLTGSSRIESTLDLVGPGLTLLTGAGGGRWLDAIDSLRGQTPIPMAAYAIGTELVDRDGTFEERFGLGADGAVLVRPDGHIAWRVEAGSVDDPLGALRAAVELAIGGCAPRTALPV